MTRRTVCLALALSLAIAELGLMAGSASASGHTTNGVYHGSYFEARSGSDYHHAWSEHSHSGYKIAYEYADSANTDVICGAQNGYNESILHVDCTGFREGIRWGTTGTTTIGSGTSHTAASTFGDGHGIFFHTAQD